MKIAIIDIIGLPYDGTTVYKQGLGGSESAVTFMADELANIGFDVTVFNNCNSNQTNPGTYNNVKYYPLSELALEHSFDIVISSRTVIPFLTKEQFSFVDDSRAVPYSNLNLYDRILSNSKQRILWMHDTFCLGDNLIEELAVTNRITDIFVLSDWHLTYVTNCNHGRRRNFEVLKRKMFITRNGAKQYKEADIKSKDKDLFVYNASVTKGMIPLLENIWPQIKQHIPTAKLKVIGGYYKFDKNSSPDEQELKWRELSQHDRNSSLDIEFTGIIPQTKIADILSEASFTIYPNAFPETYGISTTESLLYNTPVITCRFGALEEIALEEACYLIDYAITPNVLFPHIDQDYQIAQFVKKVIDAYYNPYLHQQKQYYCNIIKDIAGWDSVALQWKQFFYKRNKQYLSRDEYRKVSRINKRQHKIYNRRYHNIEELEDYKRSSEQPIVVVSTFYNCEKYIEQCIQSVATQDYDAWLHILVNDASTDNTIAAVARTISKLPADIQKKYVVINNTENKGAVYNQVSEFRKCSDDSIIMILDGDDSLVNDNTIFNYYNSIYSDSTEFTYGSCWSMADSIPLISQPYPVDVKQNKSYRQHHFNWILPYTHLRTFRKHLINNIPDSAFQDQNSNWFRAGGDGSVFYSLLEAADPNKVKCLQDIVYNYNDKNPLNDYKINSDEQNRTASLIVNQRKKKILIAIPTAKNIESETFKSIYDLIVPDGYETELQFFYGYRVDQIRNLIADWAIRGFDYLFSVDSDMVFGPDTLLKLLNHDKDVVTGVYRQRREEQVLELYESSIYGGVSHISWDSLKSQGLVEIAACGFGCALVKSEVFRRVGYPQFEYHVALDHNQTVSEDIDFCSKARNLGFKIYADTSILCKHLGSRTYEVQ